MVAIVLAAGCDVREPLAPVPVPAPTPDQVPRALVDPVGEFSSTGFLSVPGTSTQSAGSVGPTPIGGAIPRDMWVRVRTSGTVSYTINPDARDIPCGMQCVDHAPRFGEGEAGGAGIPGNFALRTYLTFSSGYEPSPRNLGNQLEWVIRVKAGAMLRARRSGIPGGPSCPACDPPAPYVGWYLLSGGTVVTVEEVIPLQAAPRQLEVVRGDSVTFDAVAIDGTTNLRWYFGDIGGAARVSACDGKTTCTIAPRRNGFMYIYGDYDGQSIFSARSETVRLVNAMLTLECSPNPVMRGTSATCTAEARGTSNFEVTGWKFVSSDDSEEVTPTDPAQNTAPSWEGPMVRSGTVTVMARVLGQDRSASAEIEVLNRAWDTRAPGYTFVESVADSRMTLPDEVAWAEDLGIANWFPTETAAATTPDYTLEVPSGPNEGMDYFGEETTVRFFGYYLLNTSAMTRGSAFYSAQERGSGGTRIGGINWCPPSVVSTELPRLVENHERLHSDAYRDALVREFPSAIEQLERVTALDVGKLYEAYDASWERLDGVARAASRAVHNSPQGKVTPTFGGRPCALKNERGNMLQTEP